MPVVDHRDGTCKCDRPVLVQLQLQTVCRCQLPPADAPWLPPFVAAYVYEPAGTEHIVWKDKTGLV